MQKINNGIFKVSFGKPEAFTPVTLRKTEACGDSLLNMSDCQAPFSEDEISFTVNDRGVLLELPIYDEEQLYGFGLQLKSFEQKGRKKTLRTNADPVADTGDSHAPVPFYVSTKGYGVFVDTARYVTFNCGANAKKQKKSSSEKKEVKITTEELYAMGPITGNRCVAVEIPSVKGIDIYIFAGPSMLEAIERYNLFSGGGCLPPVWSLGIWYRAYGRATSRDVMALADNFRDNNIPCDVMGLEPGWQTRTYSCSYVWNDGNFPKHEEFIKEISDKGYRINLWEHVFVNPESPIYNDLFDYSGDYEVWGGLVPDFALKKAAGIFTDYHRKEFAEKGISGFKIDECDSSDYTGAWSFPNCSSFPSGMDGEQMHSMLGIMYQDVIKKSYDVSGNRTMCLVRSSHGLAAPYPFVLYSDLYNHKDFIRGSVNMGFAGLLWSPEVRQCDSVEDLIRRLQTVCLSPLSQVNAWMIPNPPWWQVNIDKNLENIMMDNLEEVQNTVRDIFEMRMSLIPYLYEAFSRYKLYGKPVFRAVVVDYPDDRNTYGIDNQLMIGDSIMAAPMIAGEAKKRFYLPEGKWVNFFDNEDILKGGKWYEREYGTETYPMFVKSGTLLPLAEPLQYIGDDWKMKLVPKLFGEFDGEYAAAELFEDDGITNDYEAGKYNKVQIILHKSGKLELKRVGNYERECYLIG